MLPHFNKNDVGVIAHYLGLLILIFAFIMLAPLVVSIVYGEWDISCHYVFGIGIALTVGALLRLAKIDPQRMSRMHAIAITGLVWIIGAILAAVPLYLSGHYATFLDAVFEGVSGLTATGLSLVQDIEHLSMADNMWRFTMQFVGGQGVVVVAISLGIFTRAGNSLYSTEGREESVMPNIMNTARFIWKFAIAAVALGTIVMAVVLFFSGMEPLKGFFHALWITIAAYDTGGFAPGSLSLISYHSFAVEIIAVLLMLFGALNFALIAQVHKGNIKEFVKDIEVRTLMIWTVCMVVVFVAAMAAGEFLNDYSGMMRRGVFTIVSATTNTGIQVLTTGQITTMLSSGAFFLVAVAMAVGGSSASTAGGIKALRVGLIFKGFGLSIRRILQPRSAQINTYYNHIGRHQLTHELLSSAMIIAGMYVLSYVVGALAGIAYGYEALNAIFESISAASNAGLTSGIIQPGMPVPLELLYILQMWLGRLEFITLLALIASLIASILPRRRPSGDTHDAKDFISGNTHDAKDFTSSKSSKDTKKGSVKTMVAVVLALVLTGALLLGFAPRAYANTDPAASTKEVAAEVSVSELAAVPAHLDRATVLFEGEAVGDIMHADASHVWVTLNDIDNSISMYLPNEYRSYIKYLGSYASKGTQLRVMGEFHLACDQHDGVSDVHVSTIVETIDDGGPVEHTADVKPLIVGLALFMIAGVLSALYGYLRKKRL